MPSFYLLSWTVDRTTEPSSARSHTVTTELANTHPTLQDPFYRTYRALQRRLGFLGCVNGARQDIPHISLVTYSLSFNSGTNRVQYTHKSHAVPVQDRLHYSEMSFGPIGTVTCTEQGSRLSDEQPNKARTDTHTDKETSLKSNIDCREGLSAIFGEFYRSGTRGKQTRTQAYET